ncbi:hypothetical protein AB7M63_003195 [Bradyrhizobium japonicum]
MRSAINRSIEEVIRERRGLCNFRYRPVAVKGKAATGFRWQNLQLAPNVAAVYTRQYPDHLNTGLICGELVGLDIDTPHAETADAIRSMVSELPGADKAPYRIGKPPKLVVAFRTDEPRPKLATGAYLIDGLKCQLEVFGTATQFVAYGTHPETGRNYEWFNGSPAETPLADLPEITPAAIDGLLARAEAHFAERGALIKPASKVRDSISREAGDHPWSQINSQALANLDAWVLALDLEGLRRYASGYHSVASFRPTRSTYIRRRNRALSLQPEGIFDHNGDGYMSPIDLVGACLGMPAPDAADWLQSKLGITTAPAISVRGLLSQPARRAAARRLTSTLS